MRPPPPSSAAPPPAPPMCSATRPPLAERSETLSLAERFARNRQRMEAQDAVYKAQEAQLAQAEKECAF